MTEIRDPGVLERLADNLALLTGAVATLTAAISSAGVQTQDTVAAPKATRQKKAAASPAIDAGAPGAGSASQAATTAAAVSSDATQTTDPVEAAADDLFGEEEKPAAETPKKEETKKAKPLTQDDVRNALVAVQTALKSKDLAVDILAKHTAGNARVLSKLSESAFAALIKECNDAVAKAPK